MSLIDSIKAALTQAAAQDAKPFRLHLQPDQIEALQAAGVMEEPAARWQTARGAFETVPIYRTLDDSELLAQPSTEFSALHIPI